MFVCPPPPLFRYPSIPYVNYYQVVEFSGDRIEKRQYFAETDITVSSLLIKAAHFSDSGNYTCQPAHCPPVSAKVYILKGELNQVRVIVRLILFG